MRFAFIFVLSFMLIGCATKQPAVSQSATILIKTPAMKFYDKGFITQFDNYTQVQIYSAGQTVLDLMLYDNRVCQSTFECENNQSFNKKFLHASYENAFLKKLFDQDEKTIIHRDKKNRILIKIKKD